MLVVVDGGNGAGSPPCHGPVERIDILRSPYRTEAILRADRCRPREAGHQSKSRQPIRHLHNVRSRSPNGAPGGRVFVLPRARTSEIQMPRFRPPADAPNLLIPIRRHGDGQMSGGGAPGDAVYAFTLRRTRLAGLFNPPPRRLPVFSWPPFGFLSAFHT